MKETDEKIGHTAIYCYAYIQTIFLVSLMQQEIPSKSVFRILDMLHISGKFSALCKVVPVCTDKFPQILYKIFIYQKIKVPHFLSLVLIVGRHCRIL